jgi:hypothetical protein
LATDGHGLTRIKSIRENPRESVAGFFGLKGRFKLQFQVKDKDYFLAFVEDERRWYVFAPTAQGVHRIPVYVDAVKYERVSHQQKELSS